MASLRRANPNTIQDKFLVGYQAWFTCPGDGEPIYPAHNGWLHWFNGRTPGGYNPNVDIWPDLSEYDQDELFIAPGLTSASGGAVHLFSSRHPKTVTRHFHWMARHGVDGAFLQRFLSQTVVKPGNRTRDMRDEIGDTVRRAAEAEGRVYAIMYDVSGQPPEKVQQMLDDDWKHLIEDKHVLDSPSYLREHGRPVVALWGFGLGGRKHTPDLVRSVAASFRANTPGGVYLIAGIPGHWRTLTGDADRNKEFVQVWTDCFDAITPWTVGRYKTEAEADKWGEERIVADVAHLKMIEEQGGRKVDYMPVVLPGGSGYNLTGGKWGMNDIPRNGGRFLWRQIYQARRAGVRIMYGAMWDEYDEGTALMPVVSRASQLPVHQTYRFVALDIDGHDLPSDWYMRICGFAAEALRGERTLEDAFPEQELYDYWKTRPRYERGERNEKEAMDEVTRQFGEWQVSGNVPTDAPPPYSAVDATARRQSDAPPPVRQNTRPGGLSTAVGATALGAAAVALTSASNYKPPPVDLSTRPSTGPYPPTELVMAPPVPPRTYYDHGYSAGPGPVAYSTYGHGHAMAFPGTGVPVEYVRGRSRSRSRERRGRSRSRSGERRRRSSSRNRHGHGHGHGHAHSFSPTGHGPAMSFPSPDGIHHAYSEGYVHGGRGYAPVHAAPVGHAAYGGYAPPPMPPPQRYDAHGYGYADAGPSGSYGPGSAPYGGGPGAGRGGIQSGISSAMNFVEGVAGRQTRDRLEKRVSKLSNTLNKKFK